MQKWVLRYGDESVLAQHIQVKSMNERNELQEARRRIRELEAALADAQMDRALEKAFLDIACEKSGTTAEELKKKSGLTLLDVLGRKPSKGG